MADRGKQPIGRTGEFKFQEALDRAAETLGEGLRSIPAKHDYYPEPGSSRQELKAADEAYRTFAGRSADMINNVKLGLRLEIDPVNGPLVAMTESVIRHPDPMLWLAKLHAPDSYLIGHAQRCAILAAVVGRAMGFPELHLQRLAWAGLLSQIGRTRIPRALTDRPGPLTAEEIARIREFVVLGVDLLRGVGGISDAIVEAVQHHHERLDGSGYPRGLTGDKIPVMARIVGLVDWFDAMTSPKPYTDNVASSTEALDHLHRQRNVLFQDQIVEAFVRAVGLYPTGSLVELSTGEVALVAAQHPRQRTEPEVVLVLDRYQQPYKELERLDLRDYNQRHPQERRTVRRALSTGEFGLDAREIMARAGKPRRGWRRFLPGT